MIDNDLPCDTCPVDIRFGHKEDRCAACVYAVRRGGDLRDMCRLTQQVLPLANTCCHWNVALYQVKLLRLRSADAAPGLLQYYGAKEIHDVFDRSDTAPEYHDTGDSIEVPLDDLAVPEVYGVVASEWDKVLGFEDAPMPSAFDGSVYTSSVAAADTVLAYLTCISDIVTDLDSLQESGINGIWLKYMLNGIGILESVPEFSLDEINETTIMTAGKKTSAKIEPEDPYAIKEKVMDFLDHVSSLLANYEKVSGENLGEFWKEYVRQGAINLRYALNLFKTHIPLEETEL
ncbi:MAG: hypothetical protein AB9888_15220 [Bacteroidales bacterium]